MGDVAPFRPDMPPKPPTASGGRGGGRKLAQSRIKEGIRSAVLAGSVGLALSGDHWSAEVWKQGADPFARAWADVAATNDQVHKVLSMLIEGGMWGAVFTSTLSLIAPVLASRAPEGLIPDAGRQVLANLPTMIGGIDPAPYNQMMREAQQAAQQQAAQQPPARPDGV